MCEGEEEIKEGLLKVCRSLKVSVTSMYEMYSMYMMFIQLHIPLGRHVPLPLPPMHCPSSYATSFT